jgi:hypothetical protein
MSHTITLTVPEDEAQALAQLAKHIGWYEILDCSTGEAEAHLMCYALVKLSTALAEAGFNPR